MVSQKSNPGSALECAWFTISSQRVLALIVLYTSPPYVRSKSPSFFTASMNSWVKRTEMLEYFIISIFPVLILMNFSISGWSTRKVCIFAPRRPCCAMVFVFSLNRFINPVGPQDSPPVPLIGLPDGLSIDRSCPHPPPYLYVNASLIIVS